MADGSISVSDRVASIRARRARRDTPRRRHVVAFVDAKQSPKQRNLKREKSKTLNPNQACFDFLCFEHLRFMTSHP
jgi:hypothetical protein